MFVSIRKKLSVLTINFILITLFVTVLFSSLFILITGKSLITQGQKNIRDALKNKGDILLINSQLSLKRMVEENAFADIQLDISETVKSDSEIRYGIFTDNAGRVWAKELHFENMDSSFLKELNGMEPVKRPAVRTFSINGESIVEFIAPVSVTSGMAGHIRYGFSETAMNRQLQEFEHKMYLRILISIFLLLMVLIPVVFFELTAARQQAKEITDPIGALAKAAKRIRSGDFRSEVTVPSNDEVGVLAMDMEEMRRNLQQLHDQLQSKVSEATVQLNASLKEQLIQANKLVTLGTLVAGTAHEINNPNNAILVTVQNLERWCYDILPILDHYADICGDFTIGASLYSSEREKLISSIEQILRNSRRIAAIVQNLKNYGRKNSVVTFSDVNINEVVHDSVEILAREIEKSTSDFSLVLAPNIPQIRGNYQQLEQVVVNLVQNACQAVKKHGGSVKVKTSFNSDSNSVIVAVKDEGVGMDTETLEHMFDSFYTRKESEGGSGLGLFVSQNIILDHSGKIEIDSLLNRGTHAQITLPLTPKGGNNELLFTTID